jgi:hypothetical protein
MFPVSVYLEFSVCCFLFSLQEQIFCGSDSLYKVIISFWSLGFVSENFGPHWRFCSLHHALTFSFRLVMKHQRVHFSSEATGKLQIGLTDLDHVCTSCDSVVLLLICVEQTVHTPLPLSQIIITNGTNCLSVNVQFHSFTQQSVLRQVHSLFQSQLST